jgi:hypothetical protein
MQKHGSYYGGVRTHNGNGAAVDIHLGIKKRGSGFCCAGVIFCTKSQPDAMKPPTQGGLRVIWAEFKDGRLQWYDRQMQGDGWNNKA